MFAKIQQAITDIKNGNMIIVVDERSRENEGDLIMAAQAATPEKIRFMMQHGSGIICVPLTVERAKKMNLWPMVSDESNTEYSKCKFLVSVDYNMDRDQEKKDPKEPMICEYKTGISAKARAQTIKWLGAKNAQAHHFTRPGHTFPLIAEQWGVLVRDGHTEAAVDLCKLAGIDPPVATLVEILKPDGSIGRLPYLKQFAKRHHLTIIGINDLVEHRKYHENLVKRVATAKLPTQFGMFKVYAYEERITGKEHVVLTRGKISSTEPVLVRVHSRCLTGDVFSSLRCDCQSQLNTALELIAKRKQGVLVYLNQEGRDIGIIDKIKSYGLQDKGYDTVQANIKLGYKPDMRAYHIGTQILRDLGVRKMELITNKYTSGSFTSMV